MPSLSKTSDADKPPSRGSYWLPLALFAVLVSAVLATGLLVYQHEKSRALTEKSHKAEIYRSARIAARDSMLLTATFLSLFGGLTTFWWYRQRNRFQLAHTKSELERQILAQQLDYLGKYANDVILLMDDTGKIIAANDRALEVYGYTREELTNLSIDKLRTPQALMDFDDQWHRTKLQQGLVFETVHQNKAGNSFPVEVSARDIVVQNKCFRQAIIRDISERKQAENNIIRARDYYLALLDIIPNPIWHAGTDAKCDYFNQAWLDFTGRQLAQELGNGWTENVHAEDIETCIDTYLTAFNARRPFTMEYRLRHNDGTYHWVSDHGKPFFDLDGNFAGYIGSCYDLQQIKSAEARMEFLANHDTLTHLPNRMLLHDRIERALARAHRDARHVAVLFIDLDRFKTVNDSLGHAIGDQVLLAFAERLGNCVRDADTVSRLGGDEFIIVIPDLREANDAVAIAQKILDAMATDILLGEHHIRMTPSIGISVFPQDGQDAQTLIKNADAAMYTAKECGRNNIQFFSPALYVSAHERLNIEYGMRHALEHGEFELFYQPQIDVHTRAIIGLEALLRWHHPSKGLLLPGRFLAIAEDSGLILPIGRWVLHTACRQCRAWQENGVATIPVCVNLSPLQFRNKNLAVEIGSALRESGLAAQQLHLSITEDMLTQCNGEGDNILRALFDLGVRLTIDNFSNGQALLDQLRHKGIHTLMLDRQYVRNIAYDSDDEAVVRALISMAHKLNLKVIAEGVETDAQLTLLSKEGCDAVQGFYFSEALPGARMTELLKGGLIGTSATTH